MSSVTIRVRGAADFEKNALAAIQSIEQQVESNLDKATDLTLSIARSTVPVGTEESTGIKGYVGGTLRDSLTSEKERLRRLLGSNVPYSIFVHEGTYKMKGRPFLLNAMHTGVFEQEMKAIKV